MIPIVPPEECAESVFRSLNTFDLKVIYEAIPKIKATLAREDGAEIRILLIELGKTSSATAHQQRNIPWVLGQIDKA